MAASSTVLYFSPEFHNSMENIIILFWKYLVDIRSEAWLNLFWENINGKFFAVCIRGDSQYVDVNDESIL
jgi:hypothetical protein